MASAVPTSAVSALSVPAASELQAEQLRALVDRLEGGTARGMMTDTPTIRSATTADGDAIDELMKVSTRDLFPGFYHAAQTASSVRYIASVDRALLTDGTYFVIEAAGEMVACGGWSRGGKLYMGSRSGADVRSS